MSMNIFTLILFLIPETQRQIRLNFLFTFSACKRPFNKTKHCDDWNVPILVPILSWTSSSASTGTSSSSSWKTGSCGGPARSYAFSTCALTKAGQSVKEGIKEKLSKSSI